MYEIWITLFKTIIWLFIRFDYTPKFRRISLQIFLFLFFFFFSMKDVRVTAASSTALWKRFTAYAQTTIVRDRVRININNENEKPEKNIKAIDLDFRNACVLARIRMEWNRKIQFVENRPMRTGIDNVWPSVFSLIPKSPSRVFCHSFTCYFYHGTSLFRECNACLHTECGQMDSYVSKVNSGKTISKSYYLVKIHVINFFFLNYVK